MQSHKKRIYVQRKPKYYIRMKVDGRWLFLWKLIYKPSRPIWWEEAARGESKPYLYKTLTGARNSLDRFVSARAEKAEVAVWVDADAIS